MREIQEYLKNIGLVVDVYNDSQDCGLLHGFIDHVKIKRDDKIVPLVIKHDSIAFTPSDKFLSLYISCMKEPSERKILRFKQNCAFLSICNMPEREYDFYNAIPNGLELYVPNIFGCFRHDNILHIVMEDLSYCRNLNCIDTPSVWTRQDIKTIVYDLATIHILLSNHRINFSKPQATNETAEFLSEFHNIITLGSGIDVLPSVYNAGKAYIDALTDIERRCAPFFRVIHNDFNIRNICFDDNLNHIKLYDWEFFDNENPMMDLVDLLLSLDTDHLERKYIEHLIDKYFRTLESFSDEMNIVASEIRRLLFSDAVLKYAATRMNLYLLCYKEQKLNYINRMYHNLERLINICSF